MRCPEKGQIVGGGGMGKRTEVRTPRLSPVNSRAALTVDDSGNPSRPLFRE